MIFTIATRVIDRLFNLLECNQARLKMNHHGFLHNSPDILFNMQIIKEIKKEKPRYERGFSH